MKRYFFLVMALLGMLPSRAQDSVIPYHIADIQVMYDVMRNAPNTTGEMLYRTGHNAFSLDLDVYHRFENKQSTISAELGYTYFFRAKMGGWGLHAGWNGAYVPTNALNNDYLFISHYLIGPEYMVCSQRGNTFNFRWLGGWFYDNGSAGGPMFAFQFDWDIPNLFGLQRLSFMGEYEFMFGPEYSFDSPTVSYKIFQFASHGEATLLYSFSKKSARHWQGHDGLGIFTKMLYTSGYPLGWYSGDDYHKNRSVSITPCLGLRYDF